MSFQPGYTETALRLPDVATGGDLPTNLDDSRICYWRTPNEWWIYLPEAGIGRLTAHTVVENDDGMITVTPSIALGPAGGPWKRHGFLTRGEWREV